MSRLPAACAHEAVLGGEVAEQLVPALGYLEVRG